MSYESAYIFEWLEEWITHFVVVSVEIAKRAGELGTIFNLKAPDGIIVATAELMGLELWTCDAKMAKAYKKSVFIS